MNNFARYQKLAEGIPEDVNSIPTDFVIYKENALSVVWAPFDHINIGARIAIVGITPGWQQAKIAYKAAKKALDHRYSYSHACKLAKIEASFAGTMRMNLIKMLDEIGVQTVFGISSTAVLFNGPNSDLHTTSSLRYPVFRNGKNYTGHTPFPLKNDFLRLMIEDLLCNELAKISHALIVPLGKAANECVIHALSTSKNDAFLLENFPHPSGAKGHRIREFKQHKEALTGAVFEWGKSA